MATQSGNAHTEVPSGAHGNGQGGFPPFDPSSFASQLLWLAITFIALYIIVSRLALPRVGGIIENRRNKIEGDLAEAQHMKDESDRQIAAYERELSEARARAQTIANETRDRLQAQTEATRKTLDAQLAAKLVEAEKTIAATRQAAMANVRGIATDTAAAIVQRLTGTAPDSAVIGNAVDQALKG